MFADQNCYDITYILTHHTVFEIFVFVTADILERRLPACCTELSDIRSVSKIILLLIIITRHRASTSMYSLTFRVRVRVMLP